MAESNKEQKTDIPRHSVHSLTFRSLKRTHDHFVSNEGTMPALEPDIEKFKMSIKARDTYGGISHTANLDEIKKINPEALENSSALEGEASSSSMSIVPVQQNNSALETTDPLNAVNNPSPMLKPKWHAPWKLYRVISGHLGWVHCCAVEPANEFFATGAADRVIKIWDLATGKLKVSLTGHISAVRGLAFSQRHPYLFSCGEDKQVKCWDLETNKVIRHYHGHLSAIYTMAIHPTIDILVTAGRDSTARVWDMRTKANVHILTGHTDTVGSVVCQVYDPQIITGSHDSTIRLWDLAAGKSMVTLTNHKKSVRSIVLHPTLNTFSSASTENIKQWRSDNGEFIQNLSGHNCIINCMGVNEDGVLVSGGHNGSLYLWDWRTGYNFQRTQAPVQPGSMDSEAGVFSITFDHSGTRMITTDADKTVKMFKEDDTASEESHPIDWKLQINRKKY